MPAVFEGVPAEARTDPLLFLSAGSGWLCGLRVQHYSRASVGTADAQAPLSAGAETAMVWRGLSGD